MPNKERKAPPEFDDFAQHAIVLFGTLNNKLDNNHAVASWMTRFTSAMEQRGVPKTNIYNPEGSQRTDRNFAKESFNLCNPEKVTVINFEALHGKTSLAEARIAFLVAAIKGTALLINIEPYVSTDPQSSASREILRADIEKLAQLWELQFGFKPNVQILTNNDDMDRLADATIAALQETQTKPPDLEILSTNQRSTPKQNQIILTTSGTPETVRHEIVQTLRLINYAVVDTFDPAFDEKGVFQSRLDELSLMATGVLQLVDVSTHGIHKSRSPLAHVMSCMILSLLTGGRTTAVVPEAVRGSDFTTISSHLETFEKMYSLKLPLTIVKNLEETELYNPPIALLGTNTHVLYQEKQQRWLSTMQAELLERGLFAYEPSTPTLEARRVADEVRFIRNAQTVIFNVGSEGGNVTLAEIRLLLFCMFADKRADRNVIINIEKPANETVAKSRQTLLTDLKAVRQIAQLRGIPFHVEILMPTLANPENAIDIDVVIKMIGAEQPPTKSQKAVEFANLLEDDDSNVILSGPVVTQADVQLRAAIAEKLRTQGKTVIDTFDPNYDQDPEQSRINELMIMAGKEQYIIINDSRLSKFGPAFTAALMGSLNRKMVTFIVPESLKSDVVTTDSFDEHLAAIRSLLPDDNSELFRVVYFKDVEDVIELI